MRKGVRTERKGKGGRREGERKGRRKEVKRKEGMKRNRKERGEKKAKLLAVCKSMAALTSFLCDAGLVGNRLHFSGLVANKPLEPAEKSDVKRKSHNLHSMIMVASFTGFSLSMRLVQWRSRKWCPLSLEGSANLLVC